MRKFPRLPEIEQQDSLDFVRVVSPSTLTAIVFGETSPTGTIALGSIIENHKLDVTKTHLFHHIGTHGNRTPRADGGYHITDFSV